MITRLPAPPSQRGYSCRRWGLPHRGPAVRGAVSSPGEKEEDRVYLKHSRRASWRTQSESFLWTRPGHPPRARGRGRNSGCPTPRCRLSPCQGAPRITECAKSVGTKEQCAPGLPRSGGPRSELFPTAPAGPAPGLQGNPVCPRPAGRHLKDPAASVGTIQTSPWVPFGGLGTQGWEGYEAGLRPFSQSLGRLVMTTGYPKDF